MGVCQTKGEWSHDELMNCTERVCVPPWDIDHGSYSPQHKQYHPGDMITYSCENHYNLTGPHIRNCTEMGTWDAENPQCSPILCSDFNFTDMKNMVVQVG